MLGKGHQYAEECYKVKWFGGGWGFGESLENQLPENRKEFNSVQVQIFLNNNPDSFKVAAGRACGMLWTICKGIKIDDVVLCPNGEGSYWVGKVVTNYLFESGGHLLCHRREVEWYPVQILRSEMSEVLKNACGSIATISDITKHAEEIERFISGTSTPQIIATNADIEDPSIFALEQHLQSFLVSNWNNTLLGKNYKIFEEDC